MDRRRFLATTGAVASVGLAGCRSMFQTRSARSPPLVEDRPDAVYVPSHVEGMQMVDMQMAGEYMLALSYSFPHRFWLVNGDRTNKVEISGDDSVHLMTTVWDRDTGMVLPNGAIRATITKDGESITSGKSLWPMLSQNMGIHAGDNLSLDGTGVYDVEITVPPLSMRRTGGFSERFGESGTATFTLEFDKSALEEQISYETLPDRQGERDALDPMEMDMMPVSRAPDTAAMPGTVVGEGQSGDATFLVSRLDEVPSGVDTAAGGAETDGDPSYLAVSMRTPYNRYPIPMAALSATVTRDGTTVFDGELTATVDPGLGAHYGAVADIGPGDELTISVDTPPQISRHEGYETAFIDFSDVSVTVEG